MASGRVAVDRLLDALDDHRRADRRKAVHRRRSRHRDKLPARAVADKARDVGDRPRPYGYKGALVAVERPHNGKHVLAVGDHFGAGQQDLLNIKALGLERLGHGLALRLVSIRVGDQKELAVPLFDAKAHQVLDGLRIDGHDQRSILRHNVSKKQYVFKGFSISDRARHRQCYDCLTRIQFSWASCLMGRKSPSVVSKIKLLRIAGSWPSTTGVLLPRRRHGRGS